MIDGSTQLVPLLLEHDLIDQLRLTLYPLTLGGGKRILPPGLHRKFRLLSAKPYPTGVVGLHYAREES
jgi:dihydrofolate reductase